MKKIACVLLLGLVCLVLDGCIVAHPTVAPPALKVEVKTVKPGPNYVWISGHWKWTGGRYFWVSGHWTKKRVGKSWVPGHWIKRGGRWAWKPGHWR